MAAGSERAKNFASLAGKKKKRTHKKGGVRELYVAGKGGCLRLEKQVSRAGRPRFSLFQHPCQRYLMGGGAKDQRRDQGRVEG